MSDIHQQPTSPTNFFAVSWGTKRGVFDNYKDAQAAMKGFPSPVYKKFKNREEAEEFVRRSQPESTSIEVNESDKKFYAVARGRVIGIFKDLETAKKNTKGFPQPMHKKFDTFDEAKRYLEKFNEGKVEEKKKSAPNTPKAQKKEEEMINKGGTEDINEEKTENQDDAQETKPVARKRTYGTKVDEAEAVQTSVEAMDLSTSTDETSKEKVETDSKTHNEGQQQNQETASKIQSNSLPNGEASTSMETKKTDEKSNVLPDHSNKKVTSEAEAGEDVNKTKLEEGEEPSKKAKLDDEEQGQQQP